MIGVRVGVFENFEAFLLMEGLRVPRLYVQVSVVDVEPHGCLGLLQMVDVPLLTVESRVLHLWDDVRVHVQVIV